MKTIAVLVGLAALPVAADPVFENMSANLPPHTYSGGWEHFVGGGVAVFDCNHDRLPDVFAAGGSSPATMIRNDRDFAFTAMTIPEITGATGAYPIDIDGDGHMDIFVLRVGQNQILRGKGNCMFEDATEAFGIPESDAWSTAFTAWWEDGDTRPTLAIGNYVDRSDPDGPFEACDDNAILRPIGAGYTAEPLTPGFCPLSMLAIGDARGRLTLRLSNDRHYYVKNGYEQMWDIEDRRFLDEADGWDRVALWGMGIASRDLNGDGYDEVMLTSMGDQLMQIAQGNGTYARAPFTIGTYAQRPHTGDDGRPSTGWHAEFGDVNNDGRADLFIAKGNVDQMPGMASRDPNNLLMQQLDGTFVEVSVQAGVATMDRSRGAALADFDGDGRLDLIVSNRRVPLEIYRNVTPDVGRFISVDLEQFGGNPSAIGAVVTVVSGGVSQVMQRTIGGGHGGGQLLPLHFGIATDTEAQVHVVWPDGTMMSAQATADAPVLLIKD